MEFKHLVLGASLVFTGTANASSIFTPTDGDVNFINTSINTSLYSLYLFDDEIADFNAADKLFVPLPSNVAISGPDISGDYTATNQDSPVDTLTLTSTKQFILAVTDGSVWYADTFVDCTVGVNACDVKFGDTGVVFQVDVNKAGETPTTPAGVVPVPAAVWLFGSGLLGLIGIGRRKRH